MADLLLHSMAEFAPVILPLMDALHVRDTLEIGVEYGPLTRLLVDRARAAGGVHVGIDPAPKPEALEHFDNLHGVLCEGRSLEVLASLPAMDAYLVDGDHNHFTVLNELRLIAAAARITGRPFPLVLLHDIGWPCGRRDHYYSPDAIPPEHRHPHTWDLGMRPGDPGVWQGGMRGEGAYAVALHEGGRGNGVLTAIEDFLKEAGDLAFFRIPAALGLGVLVDPLHASQAGSILAPYHDNPLLERLERNRLELYVRVIDWQDQAGAQAAPAR
ncbi:MAG: class I SAM-dependent methyltransferase [Magnetospirillum sp.]|nr:class I SAM-dependent methyltransferase [Magnetospirillum sp.]